MIIFLHGPDDYRRDQKKNGIVAEFVKRHSDLGVGRFDLAAGDETIALLEFLRSRSIFEAAKLAVVQNAFEAPTEELVRELQTFLEREEASVLVSERDAPPKPLGFLAKKPALVQEFKYLAGSAWRRFVGEEAKRQGVRLADSAADFLAELYLRDTWRLVTELRKISLLSKKTVNRADLEALSLELVPDFWELMNGLTGQAIAARLSALERILGSNEPAAKVFNILAYRWRDTGAIAGYDLGVKSGKLDYEEALLDLAIS